MVTETIGAKRLMQALLASLGYNRDEEDVLAVCEELKKRFNKISCEWSDDGNVIYGTFIYLYGDYGTSPRSGWMSNTEGEKYISEIIEALDEEIQSLNILSKIRDICDNQ